MQWMKRFWRYWFGPISDSKACPGGYTPKSNSPSDIYLRKFNARQDELHRKMAEKGITEKRPAPEGKHNCCECYGYGILEEESRRPDGTGGWKIDYRCDCCEHLEPLWQLSLELMELAFTRGGLSTTTHIPDPPTRDLDDSTSM